MKILAVTWDDIQSSLLTLADKINESNYSPEMIVGIARGGWVVGRILSDLLNVKDLASIKIEFYKGVDEKGGTPKITQPISESPKGKLVLVADDIADTGESLTLAKRHIMDQGARSIRIATVHLKPWSKIIPDYYVSATDNWVVYPWEIRETLEHLIAIWKAETTDPSDLKQRLVSTGISADLVERYLNGKNSERRV
jgi:hypoxanthine phosphoribosyltransferase